MVPLGIILSYYGLTIISFQESIISAMVAYFFLYLINKIFYFLKKHDGLGQGDLDLFAMIGSFIGLVGCWTTILIGSVVGTFIGCIYMMMQKKHIETLPFGPFLALGAMTFVMFSTDIFSYLIQCHL